MGFPALGEPILAPAARKLPRGLDPDGPLRDASRSACDPNTVVVVSEVEIFSDISPGICGLEEPKRSIGKSAIQISH